MLETSWSFMCILLSIAASMVFAQQPQQSEKAPQPAPSDTPDTRKRLDLNLLAKEDASTGESRRNENIQFNLIDNNALKELNVRLGATATIVEVFLPDRGYFAAEFGRPASAVLHLKPFAAAKWHGNLFESHQNSVFSARSFFQAGGVQPAHDNRYGFTTGFVPWRRGFVSIHAGQDNIRGSVNGNVLVPLPAERIPLVVDPGLRNFVTNLLSGYPTALPNRLDINPRQLNTNAPQKIDGRDATLQLEQDPSTRHRIMASYQFTGQVVDAFQFVAGQNPNTDTKSHRARLTWIHQMSGGTTVSVSGGFDRLRSLLVPDATSPGPTIAVSGLTTLGPAAIIPINRAFNTIRTQSGVTSLRGNHTLHVGVGLLRRQDNGAEVDAHRGYFSFSGDFGRSGIDNLRSGTPSQYIGSVGDVHRGFRQWMPELYAGDVWKVDGRLTLNFGLRFELAGRPVEVNRLNTIPYGCDCNNFAPRFGLAYRLPSRWGVVRAAYGLHYGDIFPVTYSQVRFSPPGSVKLVVQTPDLLNPFGGFKQGGEAPDVRGNLYLLDPNLVTPYSHQYNFSWQTEVFAGWRLQLGYAGSRSHKLLIMWYLNRAQPVPGIPQTTATINARRQQPDLAEIRYVLNSSRGYFDAARATVIAPRWHGLAMEAGYTLSKAIDLGADYTNTAYDADSRQSRSQWEMETHKDRRALSRFDQPHTFLLRMNYDLPGKHRGWPGMLLNRWSTSGVLLFRNGTPFTVTALDSPGFGNVDGSGNDRPNLTDLQVLGRVIGNPDTSRRLLPQTAFSPMKPTDHAGNLGVNTFRRGGIHNLNASLTKMWALWGEKKLSLRVESINLTNSPQFAEPGSVIGNPEFGTITNTLNDGRTFRFTLTASW
ncbi:MAG: hypothetical protein HY820_06540 [Acidobacteria bacterium]|nr:hypothetical protein [Acidobacteriota bacterium]